MANLKFEGRIGGPEQLISTPQTLTGAWADLGNELDVKGARTIGLWIDMAVNDSLSIVARIVIKHTLAGSDYLLPFQSLTPNPVQGNDSLLTWELDSVIPFATIQVMAGTVGSTAAEISSAHVTTAL